ncbi:MAG: response regulator with CheY-like receiver domain and winged-helix DNA-binding domain [Pedosphaera sp.]|nr:response regulator with CheY-like receiver domain and winged-helix DNA-binding domain [Pedosphaera sp.]
MNENDTILLVEDDENDVALVTRAFKLTGLSNPLQVAENGERAIAYLSGEGQFSDRYKYPLPMLVIMDIKMPLRTGFEVLEWMRSDKTIRELPVVMLSSSSHQTDMDKAHQLGATAFLTKPVNFKDLQRVYKTVVDYWNLVKHHH